MSTLLEKLFYFFSVLKNAHQFHYTIFKNKKQYLKYKKTEFFYSVFIS